jgi:hypothetical protein
MLDLNLLLAPELDAFLEVANAINDSGVVVGFGTIGGETQAFALGLPPANARPFVYLTAPTYGAAFAAGTDVNLAAAAVDIDGTIENVAFYVNAGLLSVDTTAPFEAVWGNVSAGLYELTAVATDDSGATRSSEPVEVTVVNNVAPTGVPESYTVPQFGEHLEPAPGVLGNDTDPDGPELSARLVSGPAHGVLELMADGGFSYVPERGYVGSDQFVYRAWDGLQESADVTVDILVEIVEFSYLLQLIEGWNLVSIPLLATGPEPGREVVDTTIANVLRGAEDGTVWEWDGVQYLAATDILPLHGYWVYRDGPAIDILVTGYAVLDPVLAVDPGWALVGPVAQPPFGPVVPAWLAQSNGLYVPPIYGFGWFDDGGVYQPSYYPAVMMLPGRGYWVQLRTAADLILGTD